MGCIMMGVQEEVQPKLFYAGIDLEERVRGNHPLRSIAAVIDFDFVYREVSDLYGIKGNVSVPPPVILKLMMLLVFYNVRSERELMATVPERLDWLWFLGFDLDTPVPDHSVLSKARRRWGADIFKNFFERIVLHCVSAGLVDGSKIFVDKSLMAADASKNSVIDTRSLKGQLKAGYRELEARLSELAEDDEDGRRPVNRRYISSSDPDAALVGGVKRKLSYGVHRAVDVGAEVITASEVVRGDVNEAHRLLPLWEAHRLNTGRSARIVVADSKYGTIDTYLACHDRAIAAHIPDLKEAQAKGARKSRKKGDKARQIFPDTLFGYDAGSDSYVCPAGERLKLRTVHAARASAEYAAPGKVCAGCELRDRCTRSKQGRTIKRHLRQDDLEAMRTQSRSPPSKRDIRTRQHLMERSFARAGRYGFERARWRGLWRVRIQEYLIAAVQNIETLIRHARDPRHTLPALVRRHDDATSSGAAILLFIIGKPRPLYI